MIEPEPSEQSPTVPENEPAASPVACLLSERAFARRGDELAGGLFAAVDRLAELADGYAFRFPAADPWLEPALAFVAAERHCCPFFAFEVTFEPENGPIWIRLRGPDGTKAFVADQFNPLLPAFVRESRGDCRGA